MKNTILIFLASIATGFAQGPLTPPGAPASTMKTLDQVEARTPIESLPYTISSSGSYYFTKNLQFTAASGNAISITNNNVTLDLNGFALRSTAAVTGGAISMNDDLNNITIKNGNIAGNTTVTITGIAPNRTWTSSAAGFSYGIYSSAQSSRNLNVDHVHVSGCRISGIFASYGSVTNCSVSYNGLSGISAFYGSVTDSTASYNGFSGISADNGNIANSETASNGATGIYTNNGSVMNCTALSNGATGIAAGYGSVTNSTASYNQSDGIYADYGSLKNSTATYNGSSGIFAYSGSVTDSTAISNKYDGIYAETGSVTSCVARFNNTANTVFTFDLNAPSAVIAFTKYGTGSTTGSTLTGNLTP